MGTKKGSIPWNKGKTKETDSRVAKYGRNVSKTKQKYNPLKGRKRPPEVGEKISKALKGKPSPLKGVPRTEETKRKISKRLTGKKKSKESIEKMRKTLTGRKLTEEHKKHISDGQRGQPLREEVRQKRYGEGNPFFGKQHTPKARRVMSEKAIERKGRYPKTDTSIEILLQEKLGNWGVIFETDKPILSIARPDIFIRPNICIFADGNYWHNHPNGRERDKRQTKVLIQKGYKVLRFWGSEITNDLDNCVSKILDAIKN